MKPSSPFRLALLSILLGLALTALPGRGQSQATTTEATAVEPPPVEVVSLQDLPRQAAEVLDHVREIQQDLDSSTLLATIEERLGGLGFDISEDEASLSRTDLGTVSIAVVERLQVTWKAHEGQLSGWQGQLDEEWQTWVRGREKLAVEIERWETAGSLVQESEELATSLAEATSEVLAAVRGLDEELEGQIELLLETVDRVRLEARRVDAATAQIEEVATEALSRLGQRDSVPLWQLSRRPDLAEDLFPLVRESIGDELAYAMEYLSARQGRLWSHALLFFFLLTMFVVLRRRSRVWNPEDEVLRFSAHVLSRPLASSLLLALLASSRIYPDPPAAVVALALLASILPVWRLLPDLVGTAMRPPALAFLMVFSVNIARSLTFDEESLRRVGLLLVTLLGCGLATWSGARVRAFRESNQRFGSSLVAFVIAVFGAVMVAATVANILGWVRLAEFLATGSLVSSYVGLAILVGYFIASGLIRAFPDTPTGRSLRTISHPGEVVTTRAIRLVGLTALVMWIQSILRHFHLDGLVSARFSRFLDSELTLGALEVSVDKVASALVILLVGYVVARLIRFILAEEILGRFDIRRGVAHAVAAMAYYVIFTTGLIGAASALGLGTENLALMVSALSIGIGFGLQAVVGNFVSGLILILERPVKVGDLIEVGTILGEVGHIGIRASTIRTFEGAEVVVPNSQLVSNQVTNWTLSDLKRRRTFEVLVSWGTDPDEVIEVLQETVSRNEKVLPEPAPVVFFRGYDGGDLRFSLFFWTSIEGSLGTLSDVGLGVNRALVAAGIEVAMPNRDVRIRGSLTTVEQIPGLDPKP